MRNPKILKVTIQTVLSLSLALQAHGAWAKEGGSEGSGLTTKHTFADVNLPKAPEKSPKESSEPSSSKSGEGTDGSGSVTSDPPAEI
jgi:hypothetical protein